VTDVTKSALGNETLPCLLSHRMAANDRTDGTVLARAPQADVTTARLLEAASRCLGRWGIAKTTIDDIAREAGMAKGNFYRYFDDKADLVEAVLLSLATEIRAAMRQCATALSRASARADVVAAYNALGFAFVSSVAAHPDVARLFLQEYRCPPAGARRSLHELATELAAGAVRLSELAVEHGLIRVKDPRVSALAVVGAVERLALAVLSGELVAPPAEIAENLVELVLDGLRAPLN